MNHVLQGELIILSESSVCSNTRTRPPTIVGFLFQIMPNSPALTLDINYKKDLAPKLLNKADRFRILVIGTANSGKTTILQKMCKTNEKPEIFNSKRERVCFMCPYYVAYYYISRRSIRSTSMSKDHRLTLACPTNPAIKIDTAMLTDN